MIYHWLGGERKYIMKNVKKNINKFYKKYNIANPDYKRNVTKSDIYNYNVLMEVYNDIYDNLIYYEDNQGTDSKWVCELYTAVNDQMFAIENELIEKPEHNKFIAILKLCVFIFSMMSVGAFFTLLIEYGFDIMCSIGILIGTLCAIGSGIGYYEDIKCS